MFEMHVIRKHVLDVETEFVMDENLIAHVVEIVNHQDEMSLG